LVKMGYEDEWGMEDLLRDARKELAVAIKNPDHALFRDMNPAGQMQRLDFALMEYYSLDETRDRVLAGKIAIRMLLEDEYVIGEAAVVSLKALIESLQDMNAEELGGEDPSDVRSKLFQFRQSMSEVISLRQKRHKRDEFARMSYRSSNSGDFSMEFY